VNQSFQVSFHARINSNALSTGDRVLIALENVDIPWYVRQNVDIFPGSQWRKPKPEDPNWYDPMTKPGFSFESAMAAGSVDAKLVQIANTTLSPLDFRQYTFMEPEDNAVLVAKYAKSVLISFPTPDIGIRFGNEQIMYINYRGRKSVLAGCNVYFYPKPNPTWMLPESATAQGGELVTVGGESLSGWPETQQLVKIVSDGVQMHVPVINADFGTNTFRAPPALLNETDKYARSQVFISLNGQVWYEVPVTFTYYDPSRIVCNEAVSITNFRALHFNEPHDTLVAVSSPFTYPSSGEGIVAHEDGRKSVCDNSRLWLVREQHGAKPCEPGIPVKCGSIIRLQNMVTHTNLRSQRVPSKMYHHQEASHHGSAGIGSVLDNWELMCEPGTTHSYPPDWKTFPYDKRFHRERFAFIISKINSIWRSSTIFRLRHVATNRFLNFADVQLPPELCAECAERKLSLASVLKYDAAVDSMPFDIQIKNQESNCPVDLSMVAHSKASLQHCVSNGHSQSDGKMASGVRDGTRFYAKYHTQVAVESNLNSQTMLKRFVRLQRELYAKDFVLWYSESQVPCEMKGDVIVGQVHEVYRTPRIIVAEPWIQFNGFYNETPRYVQTLDRFNFTMSMERVYGPLVSMEMKNEKTAKEGAVVVQILKELVRQSQHIEKEDRGGILGHIATSTADMYDQRSFNIPIAETVIS